VKNFCAASPKKKAQGRAGHKYVMEPLNTLLLRLFMMLLTATVPLLLLALVFMLLL
jgi:hypothetical protein